MEFVQRRLTKSRCEDLKVRKRKGRAGERSHTDVKMSREARRHHAFSRSVRGRRPAKE